MDHIRMKNETDRRMALYVFYEDKTLRAAAAKLGVDGKMMADIAGDKILANWSLEHW